MTKNKQGFAIVIIVKEENKTEMLYVLGIQFGNLIRLIVKY